VDEIARPANVGDRFEVDIMDSDYNDPTSKKGMKLATWGGATCAAVGVDCSSGYVVGKLLNKKSNTIEFIKEFIQFYNLHNKQIKLLASDSGIVSASTFQVMTTEALQYLHDQGIHAERAEPNNHEKGTPTVERTIRSIKELTNIAIIFLLRNPNFHELGFDVIDIYKLWGELFFWSITMINLKPSPHDKTRTRFEVFHGYKPNLQRIRTIPIFSIIMILQKSSPQRDLVSNKSVHRIALFVGPAINTPTAIRAAMKGPSGKGMQIVTTSKFTAASLGGGLFGIHDMIAKGVSLLIREEDISWEEQERLMGVISAPYKGQQTEESQLVGVNELVQELPAVPEVIPPVIEPFVEPSSPQLIASVVV
jgi:hypothetical protein